MFKETYFRNSWGHATNHVVLSKNREDYIVEASPREYYNPWLYTEEVEPAIMKAIFGNKKFKPTPLYIAFARIDTENIDQIIAWCNLLGFPEYRQGRYNLDEFREKVTRFYLLVEAAGAWQARDIAGIENALMVPFMLESATAVPSHIKEEYREQIRRDPFGMARKHICEEINRRMKENFWPEFHINEADEIKNTWRTTSLLCVMHFMLGIAISDKKFPQKCGNKACSNYFTPENNKQMYCCFECKNHMQQTRFQQKKRAQRIDSAVNAYYAGMSIREAATLNRITVPALQKAIDEGGKDNEGQH